MKPCLEASCDRPQQRPKRRCLWHALLREPAEFQVEAAHERLRKYLNSGAEPIARISKLDWPSGERWCAGCQHFVPLFYATGSRCHACTSEANHRGRVAREYGLSADDYGRLLAIQDGRCYICGRIPRRRRLAVDHDHSSGIVRGLLCSGDRSCNHDILGNITDLAMAKRIVEYLEHPPYSRLHPTWADDPDWSF